MYLSICLYHQGNLKACKTNNNKANKQKHQGQWFTNDKNVHRHLSKREIMKFGQQIGKRASASIDSLEKSNNNHNEMSLCV